MKNSIPPPEPLLINTPEAARMLSVCAKTIRNLTESGELKAIRIGRSVRYSPSDLHRWIDSQRTGGDR